MMPRVPDLADRQNARSPLLDEKVNPANILMAAAEMHRQGRLTEPELPVKNVKRSRQQAKTVR